MLTSDELPLGPNPRMFGHGGWGGSLGFADLDAARQLGLRDEQDDPGHAGDYARRRCPDGGAVRRALTDLGRPPQKLQSMRTRGSGAYEQK